MGIPAKDRFKLIVSVYLILVRDGKTLLLRRANTGYEDGKYGLVSGHLDGNEKATAGMTREALEEAGIIIEPRDLTLAHVMHRREADERVDFFFTTEKWQGEIQNKEPGKCDDLCWFPLESLPSNIIPYIKEALDNVLRKQFYSERGW